jgi:hypothetical protein
MKQIIIQQIWIIIFIEFSERRNIMRCAANFTRVIFITVLLICQLSARNVIVNGEFDNGLTGWNSGWIAGGVDVDFYVDTTGLLSGQNCFMIDVIAGGENTWDIQRVQDVPIEEGQTYELYFMAMFEGAHESVTMYVAFELDRDPYTKYLYEGIDLTLDPVEYGPFEYYADSSIADNQLKFFPGGTDEVTIYLDAIVVNDENPDDIEQKQDGIHPETYTLEQNYPNPFNASTNIVYSIQEAGYVQLKIFDTLGREIMTLVDGNVQAGKHTLNFNAGELTSGIYFYQIESENFCQTKKMILIK